MTSHCNLAVKVSLLNYLTLIQQYESVFYMTMSNSHCTKGFLKAGFPRAPNF